MRVNISKTRILFIVLLLVYSVRVGAQSQAKSYGDRAEMLWQDAYDKWENEMLQRFATGQNDRKAFRQFLNNSVEFFKDRGEFFTSFMNGNLTEDNVPAFFKKLSEKYSIIYSGVQSSNSQGSANNDAQSRSGGFPTFQGTCNPACSNIGFQNGTLSSWDAFYGVDGSTSSTIIVNALSGGPCGSVTQAGGPDPNTGNDYQVTLNKTPGVDPVAGAFIPVLPPLGGYSAMIGDGTMNGQGVGQLQQTFMADASNPILTLQYAVVLENPGHPGFEQPWFKMQVLDQNNNPIPGCGNYFEVSSANLPGFKAIYYPINGDTVYCRPWTTVFVPLYNYIGQCITVIYEASDCALGGHFGYGYVSASCSKINLISSSPVFCTGQQSATITGPPGAASYQWMTSGGCISGSATQQQITITCGGTYSLVTTSSGGASCVDTFSINIPQSSAGPPPVPCFTASTVCSGNPTQFDASCSNPNSGKFYWDFYNTGQYEDSSGTTPSWTFSKGGFYNVRLYEVSSNGCGADTIISIAVDSTENSSFPKFTVTPINTTSCTACNGGVSLKASGFSGTISYTITNSFCNDTLIESSTTVSAKGGCGCSAGVSIGSGSKTVSLKNCLCPGTYYFYVKPSGVTPPTLCNPGVITADTIPFTISANGVNITTNVVTTPTSCANNNGAATVTAYGGTAPYTYTWPGGLGIGASKTGLSPGNYNVTILDSAGCYGMAQVNIPFSSGLPVRVTPYFVTCYGSNNGAIKLAPAGGGNPFTYIWSPNVSTADSAGGLAPSMYTIIIEDSFGCLDTEIVNISQPAQLGDSIVSSVTNIGCGGGGEGSATFGVTGGSPPYRFVWSDGNQSATDTALTAGTTTVNIIDANGCSAVDSVTVVASGGFTINAGPDLSICLNDSTQINVTGIPGGSSISWSPAAGLSCTNCANPFARPVIPTTYIVSVSNGGCSSTDTVKVNVTAAVTARVSPADTAICANDFFQFSASGGSNYHWTPATGLSNDTIADPIVYTTVTTTYMVTVSNSGCSGVTATATVNVNAAPPVPIITQVHGDTLTCSYDTSYSSYQWYDSTVLINGASNSFLVINHSGNYNIHITGKDGCSIAVGINVIVNPNGLQDFSSSAIIVSPNPANDKFTIRGLALYKRLMIFDVLGKLVRSELTTGDEMMINVVDLSQGIYFLQVVNDNNRWTCKFIKE